MTNRHTLSVALGARSYPIEIGSGLLAHLPELLEPHMKRNRVAIVSDTSVNRLYGERVTQILDKAGISSFIISVADGENSKSFTTLQSVTSALLDAEIERNDIIIALGGGIVGDLTGFASAILRRGCRFVQVPTTLLAQVDSSVGGKTGINVAQGKNLIGAFHQPQLVVIDIDVLDTLPMRQKLAGYAEVVKYGLINDPDFFAWLETNGKAALNGDKHLLAHAIHISCASKAKIVAADETETGVRALLNLGHTFGHALEAATGFSDILLHGEGVALGCIMAMRYSAKLGLCPLSDVNRVEAHFSELGLPISLAALPTAVKDANTLLHHMKQDKKVESGMLTLILSKGIGHSFVEKGVDIKMLHAFLTDEIRR